MRRVSIGILTVIVVLVLFVVLCTFRVRPYEQVVLVRFGRIEPKPARIMYNWYLCWPTDQVVRLDNRLHLHESALQQLVTKSGDTISMQAFAAWRIVNPEMFYRSFKGNDEAAQFRIGTEIAGKVGAVMGQHGLDELFTTDPDKAQTTHKIEEEVTRTVNDTMKLQGVEVAQVGFSRMAFPPDVVQSVYDRMSAERARKATEYTKEGQAVATKIRETARAKADEIRATAEREAAETKAAGDREALAIITSAAGKDFQFYRFWRELELLKASFGKGTYAILRVDMPLMEQFLRSGIGPTPPAMKDDLAPLLTPNRETGTTVPSGTTAPATPPNVPGTLTPGTGGAVAPEATAPLTPQTVAPAASQLSPKW